jgi:lycopene elongase/hydratase (dihydrobisanhydrobacterioruberin-forming)
MLKILFKISRPRFWLYLAGPFLIGAAATNSMLIFKDPWFYILFLYFLIFANIYLYGINDYFDNDTDKYNIKKESKESRLDSISSRKIVLYYILFFILISNLILWLLPNTQSQLFLIIFLFLATFYSAPPLRFKKRTIVDSLSNVLYIIPALVSFNLIFTKFGVDWLIIVSAWSWAAAMHLFSAIPDIEPDKKAGLKTTAILFKEKGSLWLCFLLWLLFSLIIILKGQLFPLSFLFLIYPLIPFYLVIKKIPAEKVYWYFPYITGILGFLSFWYLIIF